MTTETTTETQLVAKPKWTGGDGLGKIQAGRFNKALAGLRWLHGSRLEITGTLGDPSTEQRTVLTSVFASPSRKDIIEAENALHAKHGGVLTGKNAAAVTAELLEITSRLSKSELMPVDDKRETPEVVAARNARYLAHEAGVRAAQDAAKQSHDALRAKAPRGAQALIVAELEEDASDTMTDYFATKTVRRVAIGWRFGSREDFKQLRSAAEGFPETAHLGPDAPASVEHRENYSMGAGNYLKGSSRYSSGWKVSSCGLANLYGTIEDALPATPIPAPAPAATPASGSGEGWTLRPSQQKADYVEIVFDAKPDESIRSELKSHGFRWAMRNACWYGPAARLPSRYAGG